MRKRALAAVASLMLAAACSSSSSDDTAAAAPAVELGRGDVGPAGGTVTAGPVTIEVPAGALTDTRTIIIRKVDPRSAKLPDGTALANDLYELAPDDVTFA